MVERQYRSKITGELVGVWELTSPNQWTGLLLGPPGALGIDNHGEVWVRGSASPRPVTQLELDNYYDYVRTIA